MQAYNPVRFYRCEEDIYILGKQGKFKWNKESAKYMSIWRILPTKNEDFPCSFPIEIPTRCIEAFTGNGDVVLDQLKADLPGGGLDVRHAGDDLVPVDHHAQL